MGIIDILLLAIIGIVTWVVASDGAWGASLTFLCVVFSGLLAMNFFEPAANMLSSMSSSLDSYADFLALTGLFTIFTFVTRMGTEQISPTQIEIDGRLYQVVRWLFAGMSGYVTMAFLLTALHTAPLPREFIGFTPERRNLFNTAAPDRQWLGYTQWASERIFSQGRIFDGPRFEAPESKQVIWPTFPIRYASRRELLAKGNAAKSGASPTIVVPATPQGTGRPAPGTAF